MAEASAHKLSFVEESTRGTTPKNPRFRNLPDTRTTIAVQKDTLASERLTGSRFPAQPRTGAKSVSGDIPVDLSHNTYLYFIQSALQGVIESQTAANIPTYPGTTPTGIIYGPRLEGEDFVEISIDRDGAVAETIEFVNVGTKIVINDGVVVVEELIDIKPGSTTAKLILVFYPTDTNTLSEVIEFTIGDTTKVAVGGDFEINSFQASFGGQSKVMIKAGETRKSFSFLREFSDFEAGSKPFLLFNGLEVASWNLTAAANGIAKSTFSFIGRDGSNPLATAPVGTTYADAVDTEAFDTFSGSLEIDGLEECIVTDYNLTINNNLAPKYVVGCAGSQDMSVGQSTVEGSITAFFNDEKLYEKFMKEETLSIKITLADSVGNQLAVFLPVLRVNTGTQPDVSGDGSVTIPVNFTAHKDDTLNTHIIVEVTEAPSV